MQKLKSFDWCFGCGKENPSGLKLEFELLHGSILVAEFTPTKEHQGWEGITHGGILAALLDEAMTRAIYEQGFEAMTAEMTIRLKKPLKIGQKVLVMANVVEKRGKLVTAQARITDIKEREFLATAQGKFLVP